MKIIAICHVNDTTNERFSSGSHFEMVGLETWK